MFVLIVELQADPARAAELESILAALAADARAEPGLVLYTVQKQREAAGRYLLVEYYRDRQAWEAHLNDPGVAARICAFTRLLTDAPKLTFCDSLYPAEIGLPA